jgi:hypothetical protein
MAHPRPARPPTHPPPPPPPSDAHPCRPAGDVDSLFDITPASTGGGLTAWRAGCMCTREFVPVCDPVSRKQFPNACMADCQVRGSFPAPAWLTAWRPAGARRPPRVLHHRHCQHTNPTAPPCAWLQGVQTTTSCSELPRMIDVAIIVSDPVCVRPAMHMHHHPEQLQGSCKAAERPQKGCCSGASTQTSLPLSDCPPAAGACRPPRAAPPTRSPPSTWSPSLWWPPTAAAPCTPSRWGRAPGARAPGHCTASWVPVHPTGEHCAASWCRALRSQPARGGWDALASSMACAPGARAGWRAGLWRPG